MLNIVEKWVRSNSDAQTFLSAIEGFVQGLCQCHIPRTAPGLTVWFTGLSSAGKSTIAKLVYEELCTLGNRAEWLDGDDVRQHLSKGLGFNKEDRDENVRRIGFVAERLTRNGVITLVSAISPYRAIREEIRQRVRQFVEVYVYAPFTTVQDKPGSS